MRIAVDIREAGGEKTGKGYYVYELLKHILKQDKHNEYLLYSDQEHNPFEETLEKISEKTLEKNSKISFHYIPAKGLKWHQAVLKDLKEIRPDLFFAPTSYIIPALAPHWLKTIITVHDLVAFLFPLKHQAKAVIIERLTLKKALKKANKIFVVSENTQNDLMKMFDYPKSKIKHVPCAPADFFKKKLTEKEKETVKDKYKLPPKFILAVGTLEPRKNFGTLIKSFVIVKRKFPDHKLVIIGKKGWKYREIEHSIKNFKLENEVIFTGYVGNEALHAIYSLASVFVFPSLYEGFGIPPLEAMSSGCPVISSNIASLPEVIGDAGLLIDPRNAYKLADAIISLLENDQIREMLIERGFRRAEKFSWDNSAAKVLEIFSQMEKT